jgi:hypothetical protein
VDCNRASAFLDARGSRSLASRIFSSAAITSSSAGCIIWNDHPKFCAPRQSLLDLQAKGCQAASLTRRAGCQPDQGQFARLAAWRPSQPSWLTSEGAPARCRRPHCSATGRVRPTGGQDGCATHYERSAIARRSALLRANFSNQVCL